MLIIYNYL